LAIFRQRRSRNQGDHVVHAVLLKIFFNPSQCILEASIVNYEKEGQKI
jgi:hypothetical protein